MSCLPPVSWRVREQQGIEQEFVEDPLPAPGTPGGGPPHIAPPPHAGAMAIGTEVCTVHSLRLPSVCTLPVAVNTMVERVSASEILPWLGSSAVRFTSEETGPSVRLTMLDVVGVPCPLQEDSLGNCNSLTPKGHKQSLAKFYHLDGKVLRFTARLVDGDATPGKPGSDHSSRAAVSRLLAAHLMTPVQVRERAMTV